jgi:hypothetical protein
MLHGNVVLLLKFFLMCAWPGRGASATDVTPFLNFLLHSYTCCCEKHASPYWTFIRRWTSIDFTPSLIKKWITERCSSFVQVTSGAAILKLALWWRSVCLHYTATYRILFIAMVTCLPTYRRMARYFEFLSQFYGFHLTHPRTYEHTHIGILSLHWC